MVTGDWTAFPEIYHVFNKTLQSWKASGLITSPQVNPFPFYSSRHIAFLLGYKDGLEMRINFSDDNRATLRRLCGPNGFILYQVLLARREAAEEENKCQQQQ